MEHGMKLMAMVLVGLLASVASAAVFESDFSGGVAGASIGSLDEWTVAYTASGFSEELTADGQLIRPVMVWAGVGMTFVLIRPMVWLRPLIRLRRQDCGMRWPSLTSGPIPTASTPMGPPGFTCRRTLRDH